MGENAYYAEWDIVLTGLALGCLATDMSRFPAGRGHIERALMHAWPEWSGKDAYPHFLPRDLGIYGMRSTLMEPLGYVIWDWGSVLGNGIHPSLSVASAAPAEVLAQFAATQPVAADAWQDLARRFVAELPAPEPR
ncbi:hypothetical protein [Microbacterium sp.]|uniref:hypothetical protein n=1 Tax=Microbacterium sp. TaxID=51671 RepID=UPI0025FD49ED|nr:hypothetical protein [Microbacterium sp.]